MIVTRPQGRQPAAAPPPGDTRSDTFASAAQEALATRTADPIGGDASFTWVGEDSSAGGGLNSIVTAPTPDALESAQTRRTICRMPTIGSSDLWIEYDLLSGVDLANANVWGPCCWATVDSCWYFSHNNAGTMRLNKIVAWTNTVAVQTLGGVNVPATGGVRMRIEVTEVTGDISWRAQVVGGSWAQGGTFAEAGITPSGVCGMAASGTRDPQYQNLQVGAL